MANSLTVIPIGIAAIKYAADEDAGVVESAVFALGATFVLMVVGFFVGVLAGVPLGG